MFNDRISASASIELSGNKNTLNVLLLDGKVNPQLLFDVPGKVTMQVGVLIDKPFWARVEEQASYKKSIDPTVEVILDIIDKVLPSIDEQSREVFISVLEEIINQFDQGNNPIGSFMAYINPFIRNLLNVH